MMMERMRRQTRITTMPGDFRRESGKDRKDDGKDGTPNTHEDSGALSIAETGGPTTGRCESRFGTRNKYYMNHMY